MSVSRGVARTLWLGYANRTMALIYLAGPA
jgi:hypothetical protein